MCRAGLNAGQFTGMCRAGLILLYRRGIMLGCVCVCVCVCMHACMRVCTSVSMIVLAGTSDMQGWVECRIVCREVQGRVDFARRGRCWGEKCVCLLFGKKGERKERGETASAELGGLLSTSPGQQPSVHAGLA